MKTSKKAINNTFVYIVIYIISTPIYLSHFLIFSSWKIIIFYVWIIFKPIKSIHNCFCQMLSNYKKNLQNLEFWRNYQWFFLVKVSATIRVLVMMGCEEMASKWCFQN